MILSCNCKHEFQDQKYGIGRRVHNVLKNPSQARCTVCGKLNSTGSTSPVKVEKKA